MTTHVVGKRFLLCGHEDGSLSLTDLGEMAVLATAKEHSAAVKCISSNSGYFLCASVDGDATLWERPAWDNRALRLVRRIREPFQGRNLWSCSMNDSHLALVRGSIM